MRESVSLASSYRRRQLPAGLMQRLEIMQQLALQAKAQAEGSAGAPTLLGLPRRRAHFIVLAWFSLGVMTSGAAGVGALVGLRALEARGTSVSWAGVRATLSSTWASAWAKMPSMPSRQKTAHRPEGAWERLDISIDRSARSPLGLRVTGADDQPVYFVLDGVPVGVRLSHGALVGPSTWVLSRADLDNLNLALDEGAPKSFELKIALLAPSGVAKSGSLVQVRLLDAAMPTTMTASRQPDQEKAGAGATSSAPPAAVAQAPAAAPLTSGSLAARGEDKAAKAASSSTAPSVTAGPRVFPEGAYGLGAISREKDEKSVWSAAPPAWSPFEGGDQR